MRPRGDRAPTPRRSSSPHRRGRRPRAARRAWPTRPHPPAPTPHRRSRRPRAGRTTPPGDTPNQSRHTAPGPPSNRFHRSTDCSGEARRHMPAKPPCMTFRRYDHLETKERSHKNRPEVLDKLRYMRTSEPLPGYDALSPEQIAKALAGANAETVKAVRDYERKFGHRKQVLDEAARVLPTSQASAGEDRAREEKDARVREGLAGRQETAGGLASRRSAPPAGGD